MKMREGNTRIVIGNAFGDRFTRIQIYISELLKQLLHGHKRTFIRVEYDLDRLYVKCYACLNEMSVFLPNISRYENIT